MSSRPWGVRVQWRFVHVIMPRCHDNVSEAHRRYYQNNLACNVSASQLAVWWTHWQQYGELHAETSARRNAATRRWGRQRRVMTTATYECLRRLVHDEPELYLDEVKLAMSLEGHDVSESTIWRVMVQDFHWTLRRFTARARQRDEALREEYRNAMWMFHDPAMFIFVDETSRGRNECRRRQAWAPRGKDNNLDEFFSSSEARFTVFAAADINGFVLAACEAVERNRSGDDDDPTQ